MTSTTNNLVHVTISVACEQQNPDLPGICTTRITENSFSMAADEVTEILAALTEFMSKRRAAKEKSAKAMQDAGPQAAPEANSGEMLGIIND